MLKRQAYSLYGESSDASIFTCFDMAHDVIANVSGCHKINGVEWQRRLRSTLDSRRRASERFASSKISLLWHIPALAAGRCSAITQYSR